MPHNPFYSSTIWRETRAKYIRKNRWCKVCLRLGFHTPVAEVDHVRAIAAGGHPTDFANLQGLCKKHHSQKTILFDGQHAASGTILVTTGLDGFPIAIEKRST